MSKCPNTILLSIKKKTVIAGVHGSRHFEQGGGGVQERLYKKGGVPVQLSPDYKNRICQCIFITDNTGDMGQMSMRHQSL